LNPLDVHVVESYDLERIGQRLSPVHIEIKLQLLYCLSQLRIQHLTTISEEEELLWSEVFGKVGVYEEETGFCI
jgi:hypothetical protein